MLPTQVGAHPQKLFEAAPQLRPLFKGDLDPHAAKLMQMINVAVGKLDEPEVLLLARQPLGQRHAGYVMTAVSALVQAA